jgi:hypothetical protein
MVLDIKEKFLGKFVFLGEKLKSWEKARHVKIQHVGEDFSPPPKNTSKSRWFCVHIKILLFWSLFDLFSSNFLQIIFC